MPEMTETDFTTTTTATATVRSTRGKITAEYQGGAVITLTQEGAALDFYLSPADARALSAALIQLADIAGVENA